MEEPPVVLTPDERANEEPVPELDPEAAAPNLDVPTTGQLELARAKAREAHRLNLKPHLLLGLSIEGIEQHIASLPQDAVEQCNDAIPKDKQGAPQYPINSSPKITATPTSSTSPRRPRWTG